MPRKPVYGSEYEYNPDEEEPAEEELYDEEVEPRNDLASEEGKTSDDYLEMELAEQEEIFEQKQAEKEKKKKIRETKSKIRKLKYAPAYEIAGKAKDIGKGILKGGVDVAKEIKRRRSTPEAIEKRKKRRQATGQRIKRIAKGTQRAMTALGGSGEGKKMGAFSGDMFGVGGKSKDMNLLGETKRKPRIMEGSGSGLMSGNLLGDSGEMGIMKGDILGGKRPVRKTSRKKRKKGKRKKSRKKRKR